MLNLSSRWSNTVNQDRIVNASTILNCSTNLSVLNSSISCVVDYTGTIVSISQYSNKSSASFWLSLYPFLSPVVSLSESIISIASVDANGNIIDDYTPCNVTPPGPSSLGLSVNQTSLLVAATEAPLLTFFTTDLVATGDILTVTLLSSLIKVSNFSQAILVVNDSSQNMTSITSFVSLNSSFTNISSSSYGYVLPRLTSRTSVSVGSAIQIGNLFIVGPPNTQTFSAFNVTLYRNGSIYCTGAVNLTVNPNSLSNITVTADNSLVNANTSYTLSFTTSSALTSQGHLRIIIPPEISAPNSSAKQCVSTIANNYSGNATCTMTSNILIVTGLFYDTTPINSNITLKFNGVINPSSARPTSPFTITTYYDATSNKTD
jgi:hypothetical protein